MNVVKLLNFCCWRTETNHVTELCSRNGMIGISSCCFVFILFFFKASVDPARNLFPDRDHREKKKKNFTRVKRPNPPICSQGMTSLSSSIQVAADSSTPMDTAIAMRSIWVITRSERGFHTPLQPLSTRHRFHKSDRSQPVVGCGVCWIYVASSTRRQRHNETHLPQ